MTVCWWGSGSVVAWCHTPLHSSHWSAGRVCQRWPSLHPPQGRGEGRRLLNPISVGPGLHPVCVWLWVWMCECECECVWVCEVWVCVCVSVCMCECVNMCVMMRGCVPPLWCRSLCYKEQSFWGCLCQEQSGASSPHCEMFPHSWVRERQEGREGKEGRKIRGKREERYINSLCSIWQ